MLLAASFLALSILSLLWLYLVTRSWRSVLTYAALALVFSILALFGFFLDTDSRPPRFLLVIVPVTLLTIYFVRTQVGTFKWTHLLAIHLLRIPVELVLHALYLEGLVPQLMTYEGWNFDILSGLSAGVLLLVYLRNGRLARRLLYWWNFIALALLFFIVALAIFSAPLPIQQLAWDQPNIAMLRFPFTLLPGLVVPLVILSHFWMLRQLKGGTSVSK